ncbi:O-methyltransferase [Pigmentibacter sp. JX0631]|uniref:O-methyltransferase n=1 Tax=Pigmentibacter sp. JX0631 TaxID=2976982 RepID=UPI0024693AE0|nr:O-methyltransferase [Pigmentibacter sp. JX0631]WGL60189.1 O-methyltransferase [Pigmentibacter sp. JX0631]
MRPKSYSNLLPSVSKYVEDLLSVDSHPSQQLALQVAKKRGTPPLQVLPTDGRTLEVIARTIQPTKIVEIGTLCGYSSLFLANALVPGGKLYTCEQSQHHIQVATEVFQTLNLLDKIEIIEGNAVLTLPQLSHKGPFDIVFIDADKLNYPNYFDWAIENLRSGGLLIADNVFVFGYIGEDNIPEQGELKNLVSAMRLFNEKCVKDERLVTTFLPTGEGLMIATKK